MAKDDMEVIMYKILKYLYECMKKDIDPQMEDFSWNSKLFRIPQNYWCKIIVTLVRKGYITGFKIIDNTKDAPTIQTDRPFEITFEGVSVREGEIKVSGHARYSAPGYDVVCAGVTALVQTFVRSVENLTEDKIEYELSPGRAEIRYGNLSERSRTLVDSFFVGICLIADEFPDNVRIV